MIFQEQASLREKLAILADAAKYAPLRWSSTGATILKDCF